MIGKPEAAAECPWEKFDTYDWVSLLYRHPQFVDQCDLYSLDPLHLVHLLSKYPQWYTRCDLNKLDGAFLPYLASASPETAPFIPWEKTTHFLHSFKADKSPELKKQRRFLHYKMGRLNLLSKKPQFADYLNDWHIFDSEGDCFSEYWKILLEKQPSFKEKCGCLHWTDNNVYQSISLRYFHWSAVLFDFEQKYCFTAPADVDNGNPTDYTWAERIFTYDTRHCSDIVDGCNWVDLLCHRPQLASWCDWKKFTGCHWDLLNVCTGRILNHYQTSEDLICEIWV